MLPPSRIPCSYTIIQNDICTYVYITSTVYIYIYVHATNEASIFIYIVCPIIVLLSYKECSGNKLIKDIVHTYVHMNICSIMRLMVSYIE